MFTIKRCSLIRGGFTVITLRTNYVRLTLTMIDTFQMSSLQCFKMEHSIIVRMLNETAMGFLNNKVYLIYRVVNAI